MQRNPRLPIVLVTLMCMALTASALALKAPPKPSTPKPARDITAEWRTLKTDGASVRYSNIDTKYAKAILTIAKTSRSIYADMYGCDMPAQVDVTVERNSKKKTHLYTDGDHQMFLTLSSSMSLAPPALGGPYNIYGVSHELGHCVMYRRMSRVDQLPEGVPEGWAHYCGSVVTDEVYKRLGKSVWPMPYDYSEDGTKRLEKQMADPEQMKEPTMQAAAAFYIAAKRYGAKTVFAAMNEGTTEKPMGKDVMPRFVDALVRLTKDRSAREVFADCMKPVSLQWCVSSRTIDEKAVEGLMTVPDETGALLKYDDGASDGMLSMADLGQVVMFRLPEGQWAVDGVRMFGRRYGGLVPPEKDFSIYICDQDFEPIKEVSLPYSRLEQAPMKWHDFAFDPVKVTEGFYICIYFAATANNGFYMNYDKSGKKTHSRMGVPGSIITDLQPGDTYDWMIRVHLKKM